MKNMMVYTEKGKTLTTSLQVAEVFERRHDHILRDIRNLCGLEPTTALNFEWSKNMEEFTAPNFGLSKNVETFAARNFTVSEYKDDSGKLNPMYIMTRDGWTLLAMGFTGEKALEFKIAYINAFNQMERMLKYPPAERLYIRANRNYITDRSTPDLLAEWLDAYTEPCGFQKTEVHPSILADMFNGWLVTSGYKRVAKTYIVSMMPDEGHGLAIKKDMRD